jgi:hypothetical protein
LLLQVCRRVLGIGGAGAAADDRTRGRTDPGAAAAADSTTECCSGTGAEKSAADGLGICLVAQRGDLRIGILPARLIIVIRLRRRAGARGEHC